MKKSTRSKKSRNLQDTGGKEKLTKKEKIAKTLKLENYFDFLEDGQRIKKLLRGTQTIQQMFFKMSKKESEKKVEDSTDDNQDGLEDNHPQGGDNVNFVDFNPVKNVLCLADNRRRQPPELEETTTHQNKTPKVKTTPIQPEKMTQIDRRRKHLEFRGIRTPSPIRKIVRKKTQEKINLLTKTTLHHYEGEGGSHSIFRGENEKKIMNGRVKEFIKLFEGTKEHTNRGKNENVGEALQPNLFCIKNVNPFVTATHSQDSSNQSDDPYRTRPRQKGPQDRLALCDWPGGGNGDGLQRIREGVTRARNGEQDQTSLE